MVLILSHDKCCSCSHWPIPAHTMSHWEKGWRSPKMHCPSAAIQTPPAHSAFSLCPYKDHWDSSYFDGKSQKNRFIPDWCQNQRTQKISHWTGGKREQSAQGNKELVQLPQAEKLEIFSLDCSLATWRIDSSSQGAAGTACFGRVKQPVMLQRRNFVGVPIPCTQEGRQMAAVTKDYASCSLPLLSE